LDAIGASGWTLELNPSEEQDEMAKLTRQSQSLGNGELALRLGLEAEYDDDTGEVIIKPGKLKQEEREEEGLFGPTPGKPFRPTGAPTIGKFSELLKQAKSRPPFSKISDTLKREIDKFIRKFKRKPTEVELRKAIAKINLSLQKELRDSTNRLFKGTYTREMDRVGKELGINVLFDTIDENALIALSTQPVLSDSYSRISEELVGKLNRIIEDAYRDPKGLSVKQITDQIRDMTSVADFRAETIARTETSKVSNAARKVSYSKEPDFENFLFKWIGPQDHRTTETCKRIKSKTKNGVSWSELVKIIEEESGKDFPEWSVDKNFPVGHFNCRHTFVKIAGDTIKKRKEEKEREEMEEVVKKEEEAKKKLIKEKLDLALKKKDFLVNKKKEKLIEDIEKDLNG